MKKKAIHVTEVAELCKVAMRCITMTSVVVILLVHLPDASACGQMCFRGRPMPTCKSFIIIEIGLGFKIGEGRSLNDGWGSSEIGWMYNLNTRYAVGATSYIVYDVRYSNFRGGLKLQGRGWLNCDFSVNASGGAIFVGGAFGEEHPAFIGHIDLNYKDFVGPYFGVDILRGRGRSFDDAIWHTGVRFGSYVGSGLSAVSVAAIVFALYSYITGS